MQTLPPPAADAPVPAPAIPLQTAAGLQDDLLIAVHDLERLHALLEHAGDELMLRFAIATGHLQALARAGGAASCEESAATVRTALHDLGAAVTSLQFQDLASQLIRHTQQRLRSRADRLARDAMGDDGEGLALVEPGPARPNPVTQSEMDAGSVELF